MADLNTPESPYFWLDGWFGCLREGLFDAAYALTTPRLRREWAERFATMPQVANFDAAEVIETFSGLFSAPSDHPLWRAFAETVSSQYRPHLPAEGYYSTGVRLIDDGQRARVEMFPSTGRGARVTAEMRGIVADLVRDDDRWQVDYIAFDHPAEEIVTITLDPYSSN